MAIIFHVLQYEIGTLTLQLIELVEPEADLKANARFRVLQELEEAQKLLHKVLEDVQQLWKCYCSVRAHLLSCAKM